MLSVLKSRLSEIPRPNSDSGKGRPGQDELSSDDDEEQVEEEMTRSEMANYMAGMAGMLEQWQKEDAELLKKRKK